MKFTNKSFIPTILFIGIVCFFSSCQEEEPIEEVVQPASAILAACNQTEDIIGFPSTLTCGVIKANNPEVNFATSNFSGHIVTGVGLNASDESVKNIRIYGYQLDSNGDLCNYQVLENNNGSTNIELSVHADAGYAVVGVGALVAKNDVKMIRIWQRQIRSDGTLNPNVVSTKTASTNSNYGSKQPECGVNKTGHVQINSNISTSYMTGLKMKVDDNDVAGLRMFVGRLDP